MRRLDYIRRALFTLAMAKLAEIFTAFPETFGVNRAYFAVGGVDHGVRRRPWVWDWPLRYDPAFRGTCASADYTARPGKRSMQTEKARRLHVNRRDRTPRSPRADPRTNMSRYSFGAALGVTFGMARHCSCFDNGVLLGAVEVRDEQAGIRVVRGQRALTPWPCFDMPSMIIAGQAGFYLARLICAGARISRYAASMARAWCW